MNWTRPRMHDFHHRLTLIVVAVAALCGSAVGSAVEWSLSGYGKDFLSLTEIESLPAELGQTDSSPLVDNILRGRVRMGWTPCAWFACNVAYEARIRAGDSVGLELEESILPGLFTRPRFFDLDSTPLERGDLRIAHGLDRFCLKAGKRSLAQVTVGRQSISWGTGFFWSPCDIFAGFSPTEIERDDKPGVDAVRLEVNLAPPVALDLVYEPLDMQQTYHVDEEDSTWALRMASHLGEYDVALCGGLVAGDRVCGGEFSGYIMDAGIRGDLLQTWPAEADSPDFLRALIGIDYGFNIAWQPSLTLEYYYNGFGERDFDRYRLPLSEPSVRRLFQRGTAFNVGQNYGGARVTLTPSALLTLQSQTACNLDDGSCREYLSANWSLADNVDLLLGANVGIGGERSEFGSGRIYFSHLKVYF